MLPVPSGSISIAPPVTGALAVPTHGGRIAAWTPPHRMGIGRAASRSAPEPLEDLTILDHDSDSDSDDISGPNHSASSVSFSRTPPVRKLLNRFGAYEPSSSSDSSDDTEDDCDALAVDCSPRTPAALPAGAKQESKKKAAAPFVRLWSEYGAAVAALRSAEAGGLEKLVRRASRGLAAGFAPELLDEGEGGAYLLRDEDGDCLAVFKPADEEPFAAANPKLARKQPADSNNAKLKAGVRPGEAAVREFAAYLLDRDRLAGVPPTCMAELFHPQHAGGCLKRGSLQQFVPNDHQAWDIGPAQYSAAEVHRIGLLDIRLFNTDRHGGNILVKRLGARQYRLAPIDHGFVLPDSIDGTDLWFEWMTWPQSRQPFDADTLRYVAERISIEEDARLLRLLGIREPCVATLVRSTALLKRAAARGMTLHQIGAMLCRRDPERPSLLEQVVKHAMPQDVHSRYYLTGLAQAADALLDRPARGTRDRSKPSPSPRSSQAGAPRLKSSASSLALLPSPSPASAQPAHPPPSPSVHSGEAAAAAAAAALAAGPASTGSVSGFGATSARSGRPLASQSIDSVASPIAIKRTTSSYDFMHPLPPPSPLPLPSGGSGMSSLFAPYMLGDELAMRRNVSTEALLTAVSQ